MLGVQIRRPYNWVTSVYHAHIVLGSEKSRAKHKALVITEPRDWTRQTLESIINWIITNNNVSK